MTDDLSKQLLEDLQARTQKEEQEVDMSNSYWGKMQKAKEKSRKLKRKLGIGAVVLAGIAGLYATCDIGWNKEAERDAQALQHYKQIQVERDYNQVKDLVRECNRLNGYNE